MKYNKHNEEEIDLIYVIASILRGWRWLILWIVVGALLLGGYRFTRPVSPIIDQGAVDTLQAAIDANEATLTANETEMQNNLFNAEANESKISANKEAIVAYKKYQATLQSNLDSMIQGVERARSTLADPTATASEISAIIVQLPILTDGISEVSEAILGVANQVRAAENEITTWEQEISNMEMRTEQLTEANEELLEQLESQEAELEELMKGNTSAASRLFPCLLYAVLGGVLGAILHCGLVLIWSLGDKRLRTAEDLRDRYDLAILGEFLSERGKKHKSKIDKLLDKLTGDKQTVREDDGVYKLIAAGICSATDSPANLAVTGTVDEEELAEVAARLQEKLPEGYVVSGKSDPVYNAEFLAGICDYKVVLVEKKGISRKPKMDKLAELLVRNHVTVLGAVVR